MFDLIPLVQSRLALLLTGRLFDDPTGLPRAIRLLPLGLQPKRYRADQGQDYPFVTLRLLGGSDGPMAATLRVELIAGIWINPDRDADGDVDTADDIIAPASVAMNDIVVAFRSLGADGNYSPYSLESLTWQIGDKDGLHPGPDYYQVSALLEFSEAPIF